MTKTQRKNALKNFILDVVIEDIDLKQIKSIERFIAKDSDEPEASLCDYFGLGRWFDAEMNDCGLSAQTIIRELKNRLK